MIEPYTIDIILGLLSAGVTITLFLLGVIFSWVRNRIIRNEDKMESKISELRNEIFERLRMLTHEDRDIRTQISGVYKLLTEQMQQVNKRKN